MRSFSIVALLAMAACDGGNTDSGTVSDDTGTEEIGTAIVNMAVLKMDLEEECTVTLTGSKVYSNTSGADITVAAPDTYTITAGDSAYTPQFGFPVHMDADGEYWAAEPQTVDVEADQMMDGEIRLFNLFAPGTYLCSYDKYEFDTSTDDKKGSFLRTVDLEPMHIEVSPNGEVEPEDPQETWDVVGDTADYLRVVDNQLELVVAEEDLVVYLLTSDIQPANFSLTVVSETLMYVADLNCSL